MSKDKYTITRAGRWPGNSKNRYNRPDVWANKTKEEIKNTLLGILEKEGVTPFIQNGKGSHSSISAFTKINPEYTHQETETLVSKAIKNNIDEIAEFIFTNDTKDLTIFDSESSIFVNIFAGSYSWDESLSDEDHFYKYYYSVTIAKPKISE